MGLATIRSFHCTFTLRIQLFARGIAHFLAPFLGTTGQHSLSRMSGLPGAHSPPDHASITGYFTLLSDCQITTNLQVSGLLFVVAE